ncbi:hypothetical protein THRCLA_03530 [Thraustotheca clavata]|uniref:Uncharacterized protein n=1 Tax=Thraustotheca clavata TaxID=74557 RepID=A0A1W0A1R7_9STRA|nr:hypothetical protein THRCLA_03530 [Thraustotheca clavata]
MDQVQVRFGRPHATLFRIVTSRDPLGESSSTDAPKASVRHKPSSPVRRASISRSTMQEGESVSGVKIETNVLCRSSSEFVPTVITVPKVQKPKSFQLCSPPQAKMMPAPKKKKMKKLQQPPVDQEPLVSPPARVLHTLHQRTQSQPNVAFHYQTFLNALDHSSEDDNAISSRVHKRKREQERWQAAVRWLKDQHLVDAQTKEKIYNEAAKRQALAEMAKHIREQNQKRFTKPSHVSVAKPVPPKRAETILDLPPRKPPVPRLSKRSSKMPSTQNAIEEPEENKPQDNVKLPKPRRKLKRKVKPSPANVVDNEEQETRRLEGRKFMELQKKKRQDERRRERLQELEVTRKREEKLQHVEKVRLERLRESIALVKRTKQAEEEVLSAAENLLGLKGKPQEPWTWKMAELHDKKTESKYYLVQQHDQKAKSNNQEFKEMDDAYTGNEELDEEFDEELDKEQNMTQTESELEDKSSDSSTDTPQDDRAIQKLQALKQLTDSLSNRLLLLSQQSKPVEPPSMNWNKATEDLEERIDSALLAYRSQELPTPSFKPRSLVFCATALSSSSSDSDGKENLEIRQELRNESFENTKDENLSQESEESAIDMNSTYRESSGNQFRTFYERNQYDKQLYREEVLQESRRRAPSLPIQRTQFVSMQSQEESSDDDDLDRLIEASRDAYSVVDFFAQELLRQHKQTETRSIKPSPVFEEINDSDEAPLTSRRNSIESNDYTVAIAPVYTVPIQNEIAQSSSSEDEQTTEIPTESHQVLSQEVNREEKEEEPPQEYWDHLLKEEVYQRPRVAIVSDEPSSEYHRKFSPRTLSRQLLAAVEFQETLHEAQLHLEALEHAHEIQDTQDETMDWSYSVQRDVDIMCETQEVLKETLTYQSQAYEEQILRQAREIAEARVQSQRDISIQTEHKILQDVGTLAAWMQDTGTMVVEARDGGNQCTLKMSVAVQSDHEYTVAEVQTVASLPVPLQVQDEEDSNEEMDDYQSDVLSAKDVSQQENSIDEEDGVSEEELPKKVEYQDSSVVEDDFDEYDVPAQLEKSEAYSEGFEASVASIEHEDAFESENEDIGSVKEDDQVEESDIYSEKFEASAASKERNEHVYKEDSLHDSVIDEGASENGDVVAPAVDIASVQEYDDVEDDFEESIPNTKPNNLQQSMSLEEDYSENFDSKKDESKAEDIVEDEAYESPKHGSNSGESIEDNYSESEEAEIIDKPKEHKPSTTNSQVEARVLPNTMSLNRPEPTIAQMNDRVNEYLLALEERDEAKAQYIRHILVRKESEDKLLEIRHARTASMTSVWQQQQLLMMLDSARMANIAKCYEDMMCFPPESNEEVKILAIAFGGTLRPAQFVTTSEPTVKPSKQSELPASNQEYEDDEFENTAENYEMDMETSELVKPNATEEINSDDFEEENEPDHLEADKDASLVEDEIAEDQGQSSREAPSIKENDGGAYSSDDFAEITSEAEVGIAPVEHEPSVEEDQVEDIGESGADEGSDESEEMITSQVPAAAFKDDTIDESKSVASIPSDKVVRESKEGSVQYSEDDFEELPSDNEADNNLDVQDDIAELQDEVEDVAAPTEEEQDDVNDEYSMDQFASGEGIQVVEEKESLVSSDHDDVEEDEHIKGNLVQSDHDEVDGCEHEAEISHTIQPLQNDDEEYEDEYGDDFESNSKKDEPISKSDDVVANDNDSSNTSENLRLAMEELSKMPIAQISEERGKKYERRKAKALELLHAKESAIAAGKMQQEIVEIDRLVNYSLQLNVQEEILRHAQTSALVTNSTSAAAQDGDEYLESLDDDDKEPTSSPSIHKVAAELIGTVVQEASRLDEQEKEMIELQATLAVKQDAAIKVQTLVAKEERKLHLQETIEGLHVQIDQTDRLIISEKDRLESLQEQTRSNPFIPEQNICELSDKEEVLDHVDAEHEEAFLNESFSSENAALIPSTCSIEEHKIQSDLIENNDDDDEVSIEVSVVDGESISDEEDDASFGSRDDEPAIDTAELPTQHSNEELMEIAPLPAAIVPTPEVLDESFTSMEGNDKEDAFSGFDFVEDALPPAWFKESATQTIVAAEMMMDNFDYIEDVLPPISAQVPVNKPRAIDLLELFDYVENIQHPGTEELPSEKTIHTWQSLTLDVFDYIEDAQRIVSEEMTEISYRKQSQNLDDFDYIEEAKCAVETNASKSIALVELRASSLDEFDYIEKALPSLEIEYHHEDRVLPAAMATGVLLKGEVNFLEAYDYIEMAESVLRETTEHLIQEIPVGEEFEPLEECLENSAEVNPSPGDLLRDFDVVETVERPNFTSRDLLRDFDFVETTKSVVDSAKAMIEPNLLADQRTNEFKDINSDIGDEQMGSEPEFSVLSPIRLQSLVDDIWQDIQDEVWAEEHQVKTSHVSHENEYVPTKATEMESNLGDDMDDSFDSANMPRSLTLEVDQLDGLVEDLIDGYVDDIILSLRRSSHPVQSNPLPQAIVHTRPVYKADPLRDVTSHRQEYTLLSNVRKPFDWSAMDQAFIDAWNQDINDGSSPSSVYRSLPASAISARKQLMADLIQEGSAVKHPAITDSLLSVKDFVIQENDMEVVNHATKQIVQQTLDTQSRLVDSIFNDILDDTFKSIRTTSS